MSSLLLQRISVGIAFGNGEHVGQYADVKVGTLTIHVGEKIKKYRALWFTHIAGIVNGQQTLPSGIFPVAFKMHQGIIHTPWVSFNRIFKVPILPFSTLTYNEMLPFIYIQHTDGTEVTKEEWKQVCDIMSMYVTKFKLEEPTVDVAPREFLNKAKEYDLENW